MSSFSEEKRYVQTCYGTPASQQSIIPRRYTLTHSDETRDLFLTIGNDYAWATVNTKMRDEVLGEWKQVGDTLYFKVYLYIDQGEYDEQTAAQRNDIFRRELPLALTAIRYGDSALFKQYPSLDQAMLFVHFMSTYPQLARQENWGTFSTYSTL